MLHVLLAVVSSKACYSLSELLRKTVSPSRFRFFLLIIYFLFTQKESNKEKAPEKPTSTISGFLYIPYFRREMVEVRTFSGVALAPLKYWLSHKHPEMDIGGLAPHMGGWGVESEGELRFLRVTCAPLKYCNSTYAAKNGSRWLSPPYFCSLPIKLQIVCFPESSNRQP